MTGRSRRNHRRTSTYGAGRRLISLIMLLFVIGAMVNYARQPKTWEWLVQNGTDADAPTLLIEPGAATTPSTLPGTATNSVSGTESANVSPSTPPPSAQPEELVVGPTDQDELDWSIAQKQFEDILDRQPVNIEDMPSYWRLFRWSQAQTREEMKARSTINPFYTQVWETPKANRGKLYTLKLTVYRVLAHEPVANSANVNRVYEIWGTTEESRGRLFVVLTEKLPPELPMGDQLRLNAEFTGYFLKIMRYEAFNKDHGAPLLIGKIKTLPMPLQVIRDPNVNRMQFWLTLALGLVGLAILVVAKFLIWPNKPTPNSLRISSSREELKEAGNWFEAVPPASSEIPKKNPPPFTSEEFPHPQDDSDRQI